MTRSWWVNSKNGKEDKTVVKDTDLIVQGPVDVLDRGTATRGVAMLVDSNGSGPVDWVWFDVLPKGDGARVRIHHSGLCKLG